MDCFVAALLTRDRQRGASSRESVMDAEQLLFHWFDLLPEHDPESVTCVPPLSTSPRLTLYGNTPGAAQCLSQASHIMVALANSYLLAQEAPWECRRSRR